MTDMRLPTGVRLAHVCSSDLSIPALMPFCEPLVSAGWKVTMITPDGPNVGLAAANGIAWERLGIQRRMDLPGDLRGVAGLARLLRRGKYDIVHTHNIKVGQIGRVVAALVRTPLVVHTVHGMAYSRDTPYVKRCAHTALEWLASIGCDLVLTQSVEDRDTLRTTGATPARKLAVIGNGIDLHRFRVPDPITRSTIRTALGLVEEEILFFSAGRLIREKGFLELFEAARLARKEDSRVRVAIAGSVDTERADAISESQLSRARQDGVLLLGKRSDIPELISAADVVCLPSWHEGMPRVLMEGAAMGKPLLATDVVGCREIVRPPANGLLVSPRDPSALAAAMVQLAGDPAGRERIGRANAVEARTRYNIDCSVTAVNAAYLRLLKEHP